MTSMSYVSASKKSLFFDERKQIYIWIVSGYFRIYKSVLCNISDRCGDVAPNFKLKVDILKGLPKARKCFFYHFFEVTMM